MCTQCLEVHTFAKAQQYFPTAVVGDCSKKDKRDFQDQGLVGNGD
jgi:hypothetical protein